MDGEEILTTFYDVVPFVKRDGVGETGGWATPYKPERWRGVKPEFPLIDADTGEEVAPAGTKISARQAKRLADNGLKTLLLSPEALVGRYLARDEVNPATGEIYAEAGDELDAALIAVLEEHGFTTIDVLDIDHVTVGAYIRNTLRVDKNASREDALFDIYRVMRPGEPPTVEAAEAMFKSLFFDQDRYDLSSVGRVKMNIRLELDCPDDVRVIRKEDVLEVLKTLVGLRDGRGEIDDIDNLGNRRVRSVGELLENQYRVGLLRMERAIKERMSSVDIDTVMPHDLINAKPAAASVREFFGSSQLSQFMDQTNPLSEITHKRRLSALGPGGLTRERAGFEVRDVHPTHYGRICPIETPEGPNIGLINSLATHAVVNKYGFIESPYRRVKDGKITDEVVYMSAMEEAKHVIAQANIALARRRDRRGPGPRPRQWRAVAAGQGPGRPDGRQPQAGGVGGRGPDPVPGKRRRQPRPDGFEHAAPGRAADPVGRAPGRHRHGGRGRPRLRRRGDRPASGHRRTDRRHPDRHPRHRRDRPHQAGRRYLSPVEVPALEPEHLHQPASAGAGGRQDRRRRHHRRRPVDGPGRTGPGPQRPRRLHALERLQLRGLDPDLRAHRAR